MSVSTERPLEGAQLLFQNPEVLPKPASIERGIAFQNARFDFMDEFALQGGTLVEETPETDYEAYFADPHHYTMEGSGDLDEGVAQKAAADPRIQMPRTALFQKAEAADAHLELPYVLAFVHKLGGYGAGGYGKYLIESPEQHARARAYLDKLSDSSIRSFRILAATAQEREYIETPSAHYSSLRVVASAAGSILAAGLLYSGHDHQNKQYVRSPVSALEDPDSKYYLNSLDIRSNLSQGGAIIPLTPDARLTSFREEMLEAHGIDPLDPRLPEAVERQAAYIARTHARPTGLVYGLDFLVSASDARSYFLESNSGVNMGIKTYGQYHDLGRSYAAGYNAMFRQVVQDMATKAVAGLEDAA